MKIATYDDIRKLGKEIRESAWGIKSVKTNIFLDLVDSDAEIHGDLNPQMYQPGFGRLSALPSVDQADFPGNVSSLVIPRPDVDNAKERKSALLPNLIKQLKAFRQGLGPEISIKLDLNFNFKEDGIVEIAQALEDNIAAIGPIDWIEYDILDPLVQGNVKARAPARIKFASCEALYGIRQFKPFLEADAVTYPIIDVLWNGAAASMNIATLVESFNKNCATHNYHGWLGTAISAHFSAAIPNLQTMEVDVDDVPWKDVITDTMTIKDGKLILPSLPEVQRTKKFGWGVDLNEDFFREFQKEGPTHRAFPSKDPSKGAYLGGFWSEDDVSKKKF